MSLIVKVVAPVHVSSAKFGYMWDSILGTCSCGWEGRARTMGFLAFHDSRKHARAANKERSVVSSL